jgi:hypothetical protein
MIRQLACSTPALKSEGVLFGIAGYWQMMRGAPVGGS